MYDKSIKADMKSDAYLEELVRSTGTTVYHPVSTFVLFELLVAQFLIHVFR